MNRRQMGTEGEVHARKMLEEAGMTILQMNFRCPYGEIDIIARDGERTVFVEVKRRSGLGYGTPGAAVDAKKQRKIVLTALTYMQANGLLDSPVRFDVIEILPENTRHIAGAFDASDIY